MVSQSAGSVANHSHVCAHRDNGVADVWLEVELAHIYYVHPRPARALPLFPVANRFSLL